ncbi:MAG TPA: hypothetical protein VJC07_00615 [Candidatus Nanoarchaeia archaeon]|nr:hypothetical protein [Candidatus Nanoarchaeia archaeon]
MDAKIINLSFWLGTLLVASSFLIKSRTLSILLGGIIIIITSFLLESISAKKHHDVHIRKVVIIHRLTLVLVLVVVLMYFIMIQKKQLLRPDNPASFYVLFLLNIALIIVLLIVCVKTLSKRDKIIPATLTDTITPREQLVKFIKDSLASNASVANIRLEATKQGWPKDIVNEEVDNAMKGKESPTTIALHDYKYQILKKYIKRAALNKYSDSDIKAASLKAGWPADLIERAIRESKKEMPADIESAEEIEDLPQEIFRIKDYETDFDKLYNYIKEKGTIKLVDVAKMFGLSKQQAEEWAQILANQKLLKLHYPPFGEPELQWIK